MNNSVKWIEKSPKDWKRWPVFDQGNIPSCVAHAVVKAMQVVWHNKTGKIINFSPRFLDILSWTEDLSIEDGRDPKLVCEQAITIGCCTEELLPNDTTLPIEQYRDKTIITKAMFEEASKYRLSNYNVALTSFQTVSP